MPRYVTVCDNAYVTCRMKVSAMMQTPQSVAAGSKPAFTPQAPPSASPLPVGTKSGVQPIAALNPYDTNVSSLSNSAA
jgi:hypothetical protein